MFSQDTRSCKRNPFYDPLLIIEKTDGYMEGDHQWIMMVKKER